MSKDEEEIISIKVAGVDYQLHCQGRATRPN